MADAKLLRAANLEETRGYFATLTNAPLEEVLMWAAYQTWTLHSQSMRADYIIDGSSPEFVLPDGVPAVAHGDPKWTDDNFWIAREAIRFEYRAYETLWFANRLFGLRNDLWWHFPHMSVEDPGMLAYTPSVDYGKRDRQVRVKVGKYLTQFYGEQLSACVIRDIVNGCKKLEVQWAVTAGEIMHVYVNGPSSCMSGDQWGDVHQWGSVHPAMVYEGEFRLAYLARNDNILARGLVHDPSKTWVRVYGEEADTLASGLNDAGFAKEPSWPDGAELKLVQDRYDRVLMPFIDGKVKGVRETVNGFVISEERYDLWADGTTGYYAPDGTDECEDCGNRYDAETEGGWSEYHEMHLCPSCCENRYTYAIYNARGYEGYVRNDDVITVNGTSYADNARVREAYDIRECAFSGEYFTLDNMVELCDGDMAASEFAMPCGANEDGEDVYATPDMVRSYWSVAFSIPSPDADADAPLAVHYILNPDYNTTALRAQAAAMGLVVETAREYAKRVRHGDDAFATSSRVRVGGGHAAAIQLTTALRRSINNILRAYEANGEDAAAAAAA